MSQLKQLIQFLKQGYPLKGISRNLGISRNTIKGYIRNLEHQGISLDEAMLLDDQRLDHLLRFPARHEARRHMELMLKLDSLQKELKDPHVTRQLLWEEYKREQPTGYNYSRFCYYLQLYDRSQQAVLSLEHTPGDKLFVDFSGDKLCYRDAQQGREVPCEVFLTTLGYSNYTAAIAVHSQKLEDVIYACTRCIEQIGGAPKAIVPDNLKAAVIQASRYEPRIHEAFQDMASHYGMVVLPARPYKARDKAKVEVSVRIIYQRVFAPLRKMVFGSLQQLNEAIAVQMQALNDRLMQQYGCSRRMLLDRDERSLLTALPVHPYELKTHLQLTVQQNCHVYISRQKRYYSVPYRFIGQKAQVILSDTLLRVYIQGNCVATHPCNMTGKYITCEEHLPSHHRVVLAGMNEETLRQRAKDISEAVLQVINTVLKRSRHPEQAYKTCQGILALARKTSLEILSESCSIALQYDVCSFRQIERIATGRYANRELVADANQGLLPLHDNIRGASHYVTLNHSNHELPENT